jgi:hypothetical protein
MPDLDPNEVAAWFRQQAKKCLERASETAKEFEQMAIAAEKVNMVLHWGTSPGPAVAPVSAPLTGTITAAQLEERIRRKSARIRTIAREFNVAEKTVKALLEPASKVHEAERGWLKIRPNIPVKV